MTLRKRLLDMLPALIVFALVAAFATYVAIAYIVRDPFWIQALAELRTPAAADAAAEPAKGAPAATLR